MNIIAVLKHVYQHGFSKFIISGYGSYWLAWTPVIMSLRFKNSRWLKLQSACKRPLWSTTCIYMQSTYSTLTACFIIDYTVNLAPRYCQRLVESVPVGILNIVLSIINVWFSLNDYIQPGVCRYRKPQFRPPGSRLNPTVNTPIINYHNYP